MARRRSLSFCATLRLVPVVAFAAAVPAQAASFKYPRYKSTASGTIQVSAFLASLTPKSTARPLVTAATPTPTAPSSGVGQTTYSLTGSTTTMNTVTNTITLNDGSITRNSSTGSGLPLTAANGTCSEPPRPFAPSARSYALALNYSSEIDLAVFSEDRTTSPNASGCLVDGFTLRCT
jgi:hypothetical protein